MDREAMNDGIIGANFGALSGEREDDDKGNAEKMKSNAT